MNLDRKLESSARKLLVTTALEETWGGQEEIVFLGEWCKLYDRKDAWSARKFTDLPNHWDDRAKLARDHDYLKALHEQLLIDLSKCLGDIHGIDRPLRYWRFILDPWLIIYVTVLWDRWETLRSAFESNDRIETQILNFQKGNRWYYDYYHFLIKVNDDKWNHEIYAKIIDGFYRGKCRIISADSGQAWPTMGYNYLLKKKGRIAKRLVNVVDWMLRLIPLSNHVLLYEAFFPPLALISLQFRLRQIPRIYASEFEWPLAVAHTPGEKDDEVRDRVSVALKSTQHESSFEQFLYSSVSDDIPYVYLEGFKSLRTEAAKITLSPKVILTATAHSGNEKFKSWAAEKICNGTKLIILEHGGGIPTATCSMQFQEDVADIRTTWSTPYHSKHIRMPASKLVGLKIHSTKETLAVVGLEMRRYVIKANSSPKAGQTLKHFDMLCELYGGLNEGIKECFVVKPYPDMGWNTRQRFIDRLGIGKVSNEKDLYRFFATARVIVCNYPQTTFAEAMESGLPTVLLYPDAFWETIPELDELVALLRKERIVFHDPLAAAEHINSIWNDPESWWNGEPVIYARSEFRRQALGLEGNAIKKWVSFIRAIEDDPI